ncbi:hypothetical protein P3H15_52330 [Rhodococcus sp. T2V]|uniref:hypothetical protein n=1 Tax=Rhodococcus sp. T2V TaxID=3034164 RepID=UPI0023E1863D|nr:hypothetical protein [Rhodococcus sp. T2V]MDF3313490.1 hypothetical protein [Rhodococcus sp. T2V]
MGTEFDGRAARTDPDHEQHPADTGAPDEVATPTERDRELSALVDHLEERVAAEHEAHDVPGNAADRAEITPTDTGDDAPD